MVMAPPPGPSLIALLLLPARCHALSLSAPPPLRPSRALRRGRRGPCHGSWAASHSCFSRDGDTLSPLGGHPVPRGVDRARRGRRRASTRLRSSTDAVVDNGDASASATPLALAAGVGLAASLIGYLYSKFLKLGFRVLWKIIPSALFGPGGAGGVSHTKLGMLGRLPVYIPFVMTLGGALVATLSTFVFPKLFSAKDYVKILSGDGHSPMDEFPTAWHLFPVMLLSMLTSVSGFSLGPEAPMVTAGGLAGVSLARRYLRTRGKGTSDAASSSMQETLAYAGAAGTLTGFMNIPLAGPIFALEMVSRDTGISTHAARSWGAAMAASLAGMVLVNGVLAPGRGVGGHFYYGARAAVGSIAGREMILTGLGCGVGGAVVGTLFQKAARAFKSVLWRTKRSESRKRHKFLTIAKMTSVAAMIGLLSAMLPQTMFWGEGSLQHAVDGGITPLASTSHGIPSIFTSGAIVDPNAPFAGTAALKVGVGKLLAIAAAYAGGYPGGVIFPLLSCGAYLSHAATPLLPVGTSSLVPPAAVMGTMAATLTSVTRTPLATALILGLTASGTTPLTALLPGTLLASYVSVWASERLSEKTFFAYSE